jgi:hypothetical protein
MEKREERREKRSSGRYKYCIKNSFSVKREGATAISRPDSLMTL